MCELLTKSRVRRQVDVVGVPYTRMLRCKYITDNVVKSGDGIFRQVYSKWLSLSNSKLHLRLSTGELSCAFQGLSIWNSLPSNSARQQFVSEPFKGRLKTYLFGRGQ